MSIYIHVYTSEVYSPAHHQHHHHRRSVRPPSPPSGWKRMFLRYCIVHTHRASGADTVNKRLQGCKVKVCWLVACGKLRLTNVGQE